MYVEPFAGACGILLARPYNSEVREVVNDLDDSLINLWEVVRLRPEELISHLNRLPYSRNRFRQWRRQYLYTPDDWRQLSDMERAVRFFYLLRTSFSSWIAKDNAGFHHHPDLDQKSWAPRAFRSATARIAAVSQRIQEVLFENLDFAKIITKYDHRDTLFYVDSPYTTTVYRDSDTNPYYRYPWVEADDRRLAAALNECQARVMVSNYICPLVDTLYAGWRRVERDVFCASRSHQPSEARRTELLLMNYDEQGARL
jgi:DNA adenine methylase